ncbi:lipopolysaccharide kinase InaA family protein [Lentisphaera profundi]|uniref:Lipopolysaccharide kinase InaA family protein n=1 Tax=Lentisphaera profundi TaxID=1658616 RepID=A0ABY7VNJ5_9BACT|nr:lipopolysaccharide kinase InaA family protein [Lentisphaera profundi]WDE95691.1 lipopolysaccharide kinase InaA family protein [Lentisphaera profundi]
MNLLPCLHGTFTYYHDSWLPTLTELGITPTDPWTTIHPGISVSRSKRVNCFLIEDNHKKSFYKTYQLHDKFWEFFFRPSKCLTEVRNYETMKKIGIPCPTVLAYGERRSFGSLHENFIVTDAITDAQDLSNFAEEWFLIKCSTEKNRIYQELSQKVLKQTKLAHRNNFFHFDLHWRNILIKKDLSGNWQSFWIDSPRGCKIKFDRRRGYLVDLSCLARFAVYYLTRTQRYRFICDYLDLPGGPKVKALFRAVDARLARRPPPIPRKIRERPKNS